MYQLLCINDPKFHAFCNHSVIQIFHNKKELDLNFFCSFLQIQQVFIEGFYNEKRFSVPNHCDRFRKY